MLRTPLYQLHVAAGARMFPFAGWEMPVQYGGIVGEHTQTREGVSLFDICHMGECRVTGPGAATFLDGMITSDIAGMEVGRCRYGLLLNEQGRIIDDLVTYRLADDDFMLVVNAATTAEDMAWLMTHCPADLSLRDISERTAKIDIQGPDSLRVASKLCGEDLAGLKYFRWTKARFEDTDVLVSRTGYTGEMGFECYLPAAKAPAFWSAGVDLGTAPAGLGARDTLRLEAALPLSGQDIGPDNTPAEAGLDRFVKTDRNFIGRAALFAAGAPERRLVGFASNTRRSARHGHTIVEGADVVGTVTSASFSPTLGKCIGLAYVPLRLSEPGTELTIDTGRNHLQVSVVPRPFYQRPK